MKTLVTVITLVVLCTNSLRVMAVDDQCIHYQFRAPFYPGRSCKDIYIMNPESRELPGYYWILDSPTNVYCGMNYTGLSCEDIYNNNPETGNKNGYYPINNTRWTFCNMTAIAADDGNDHFISVCGGNREQWRKIASINISAGDDCPIGWSKSSHEGVSFCTVPSNSRGCYSANFSTNKVSYQKVCGRARGYQRGAVNGFLRNTYTIDNEYVEGLSITHGNPRQHIWTYGTGLSDDANYPRWNCPCAVTPGLNPPCFVGNNYYCESGAIGTYDSQKFYLEDPLWDNAGCSTNNSCCSKPNQPWFYYQLGKITKDDIEVRICIVGGGSTLVDILELYIQ